MIELYVSHCQSRGRHAAAAVGNKYQDSKPNIESRIMSSRRLFTAQIAFLLTVMLPILYSPATHPISYIGELTVRNPQTVRHPHTYREPLAHTYSQQAMKIAIVGDAEWGLLAAGVPSPSFPPRTQLGPHPNPCDPTGPGISDMDRISMGIPGDEWQFVESKSGRGKQAKITKLVHADPVRFLIPFCARYEYRLTHVFTHRSCFFSTFDSRMS